MGYKSYICGPHYISIGNRSTLLLKMKKLKPKKVKGLTKLAQLTNGRAETQTQDFWCRQSSFHSGILPSNVAVNHRHTHIPEWVHLSISSSKVAMLASWEAMYVYFSDMFEFPLSEMSSECSKHSFDSNFITFCGGFDS